MTTLYIPDTNIISNFLRDNPILIENFAQAFAREHEILLCPVVY
ncbi:MAG: hypothetical protein AAF639_27275 [Chloroflexota bacterium]